MPRPLDIARIRAASTVIDPAFLDSPMAAAPRLDQALGCHLSAKVEFLNPIGSFKGRGAEYFVATELAPGEPIVCASAGNFGQGLARAATRRSHACTVFAAETANPLKIEAMRGFGADVRLAGQDFDAAKAAAKHYAAREGLRFVEDGLEPAIAEGAGTLGLEIAASGCFDSMIVPLGNGALLAGVGAALRDASPHTRIVAVVAAKAPSMMLSLDAGRALETEAADTIADGIAIRVPIPEALETLRGLYDEVMAVSEEEIFGAMMLLRRHLGYSVEPSGAVGVAAILAQPQRFAGQQVATLLCGANLSPAMAAKLAAVPV